METSEILELAKRLAKARVKCMKNLKTLPERQYAQRLIEDGIVIGYDKLRTDYPSPRIDRNLTGIKKENRWKE